MTHQDFTESEIDELHALSPHFASHEVAIQYLEGLRWPNGPVCPHCGDGPREHQRIKAKSTRRKLWRCKACAKQFTVTVGTIFEDSHIDLNKWLLAFYLLSASKKGMSALQIQRMLRLGSYRTAWFMCHRIRESMSEPADRQLVGIVEADETYIGGNPRNRHKGQRGTPKRGRGTNKAPVVALVERGGRVRSAHVANLSGDKVKSLIRTHVHTDSTIMTDSLGIYRGLDNEFAGHETVNHAHEYVRGNAHTNTAENFFSLLKRGINGSYHFVSKAHLHRYLNEFDFRYNARHLTDSERTRLALRMTEGKRLMYADSR